MIAALTVSVTMSVTMSAAWAADVVVTADTLWTGVGPPIADGVVVVRGATIAAVGPASTVAVPAGATVVHAVAVTPGFVDGLSVAGLTGPLNKPFDQDHRQPGDPVVPELRAIDAYAPWDELVGWLRQHGVTTVNTGPSPGAPVGGTTLIASTIAGPGYVVAADGMVVVTLGESSKDWPGAQTRMGDVAEVRQAFAAAREYRDRRKLPLADRAEVDLGAEALVAALDRKRRVVIVAHRSDDLLAALRLRDEFGLDVILAGATEGYLVRDALAAAKVPVLVGPVMARQWSSPGESHDGTFENAHLLDAVGVPIGLMSGYEDYVPKVRVIPFEAAIAAANGLGEDRAIAVATFGTASILGIADRKGSLAVGKDADLVLFDGDPLEVVTHTCKVMIAGVFVEDTCR
ncbi:MAG: amidohydrolase family protein [Myxococcota bacterium]